MYLGVFILETTNATPENLFEAPKSEVLASASGESGDYSDGYYYAASTFKFCIWSICTLGFWPIIWSYRNFKKIEEHQNEDISPLAGCIFFILFVYGLFSRIQETARTQGVKNLPLRSIAVLFIILTLANRLLNPFVLLGILDFLLLLPANIVAARVNKSFNPNYKTDGKFAGWTIPILIIWAIFTMFVILGNFMQLAGIAPMPQ